MTKQPSENYYRRRSRSGRAGSNDDPKLELYGACHPSTVRELREMIRRHRPKILGLLETKLRYNKWDSLRVSLGFCNCLAVDRVGLSGGMAVLWGEDVEASVRSYSRFHVDLLVEGEEGYRVTLFYDNPNRGKRGNSWELLRRLADGWEGPWVVMGDFNEVLVEREAVGRRPRDRGGMRQFKDAVESCGLVDLAMSGYPFTYSNKRIFPDEAKGRLDRYLADRGWLDRFPNAKVSNEIARTSDHRPIILHSAGERKSRSSKGFTYEPMWQQHKEFAGFINQAWQDSCGGETGDSDPGPTLKKCSDQLVHWNRTVFGNVKERLRKLKERLEVLGRRDRTEEVMEEERRLSGEVDEWLEREEALWFQRARVSWIKEGDRNTRFFHARASQRRKTNAIERLLIEGGDVAETQEQILEVVRVHFERIFESEARREIDWEEAMRHIPNLISEERRGSMIEAFTSEDVKNALFAMAPDKAPGVDGFKAGFYQRHWSLVGVKL